MTISISRELLEREQNLNPAAGVYSYNDLFGSTWLASHVRLVELEPSFDHMSNVRLLTYALSRQLDVALPLDWLWQSYLVPSQKDDLEKLIRHAVSDILEGAEEEHKGTNERLRTTLEALDVNQATEIHRVSNDPDRASFAEAYPCGPTYQACWRSAGKFYLLEIHNES